MLHFEQTIHCPTSYFASFGTPAKQVLFFDIETTGFSPENSYVYLIGCAYLEAGTVKLRQWFLDDISEEKKLVQEFGDFVKNFHLLVHYNGTTFDLPYLQKKARRHQLPDWYFCVKGVETGTEAAPLPRSFDVYRHLLACKKILRLQDIKQRTVEQYLGIQRRDILQGRDLIMLYTEFIGRYRYECILKGTAFGTDKENHNGQLPDFSGTGLAKMPDCPANTLLCALLLHNREDLSGLLQICRLLALPRLLDGDFSVAVINGDTKEQIPSPSTSPYPCRTFRLDTKLDPDLLNICFGGKTAKSLLEAIPTIKDKLAPPPSVTITTLASTSSLLLCIPVISGTLKYFFENYKDYYYLPMEDCAMHKSIAQFVSKEYRKRATRETCYQKKQGDFLPQPEKIITPAFCIHAKDSFTFFENTKDALANPSTLKNWAVALLKWLLS